MPSLSFFHKKGAALQAERPKRVCLNCKRFVKFSQIHRKRLFKRHATCYNTDKDKGNRLPDPDLCLPH